jgi:hypothetical protein
VVTDLSDLLSVLRAADRAAKAEICAQLGLRLIYERGDDTAVRPDVRIARAQRSQFEGVRGGTDPITPRGPLTYGSEIDL